jgi:hypothetical protein
MGGKSGGGSTTNSSASTMPTWAKEAHKDLMARANTESFEGFTPYTGDRVTGQDALTGQGITGTTNLASGTNQPIQAGMDVTGEGINSARNVSGYDLGNYAKFNSAAANEYMSPYQQGVTDIAKRSAVEDYQKANIGRASDLVAKGAFGGSRQAIIQSEADKALMSNMTDIQTKGLQDAWLNAQTQFGKDRDAYVGQEESRYNADKFRTEQLLAGADQIGQMGADIYGRQMDIAGKTYAMGKDEEARQQAAMDAEYQDYLTNRDWSKNQMGWYSGIMAGNAAPFTNYTGESSASANPAATLLGLGSAAIGAAKNS